MKPLYKNIIAIAIGLAMSLAPLYPCIEWAAGGDGTYLPLFLVYGPGGIFYPLALVLYAMYILAVRYDRRLIFVVLFVHYLSFYACLRTYCRDMIQFDFLVEHLFRAPTSLQMFIVQWLPFVLFAIYNLFALYIVLKIIFSSLLKQKSEVSAD